jgi:hypothetical protein
MMMGAGDEVEPDLDVGVRGEFGTIKAAAR